MQFIGPLASVSGGSKFGATRKLHQVDALQSTEAGKRQKAIVHNWNLEAGQWTKKNAGGPYSTRGGGYKL
jgi:hypothetical protein